ncbi:MAG: hypothetical protein Kow0029_16360 [Candidatus Rifleibacteriota bacterium]
MDRRRFMIWATAALGAAAVGNILGRQYFRVCPVRIFGASDYGKDISKTILTGMTEDGISLKGKKILIKPNFVEYHEGRPINTDPRLLASIVEACKKGGAAAVTIGEAAGHRRDSFYSVLNPALRKELPRDVRLIDMNYGDVSKIPNKGHFTRLPEFYVSAELTRADIVINVPKMKTHHWVGVTLSMKNLFGTVPGTFYGWPKNLLHMQGIRNSILDLSVSVPVHYVIIDGIIGMEGDGPIMGGEKKSGLILMSKHMLAADVTAAEIMGFIPEKVEYLSIGSLLHSGFQKKGRSFPWEKPERFYTSFKCVERFSYMKSRT